MDKKTVRKFLDFFSTCPICNSKIHKNYLVNFLLRKDPDSRGLKQKLFNLTQNPENFSGKIKIGVPCCICYRKIFPNEQMVPIQDLTAEHYTYLSAKEIKEILTFLMG